MCVNIASNIAVRSVFSEGFEGILSQAFPSLPIV